jgi:hypothetical protein
MQKTKRNTAAEAGGGVLIPKDTCLAVGVDSVSHFINKVPEGDHKGRKYDKYKLRLIVLEPGEFNGKVVSISLSARTERRTDGAGNTMVDNYGSSKSYAEFLKALDPAVTDEELPMPESDEEAKQWGQTWIGRELNILFGTYKFKDQEGKEITTNTFKEGYAMTPDQLDQLAPAIAVWKVKLAAKHGGGAADDFSTDDLI